MKTIKRLTNILFLFLAITTHGQTNTQAINWENEILKDKNLSKKEYRNRITKYDFGALWTNTDNSSVYGFIGDNYQRIRIKIISATKDKNSPDTYTIFGKSMIKNNICQFTGTIKITKARIYKNKHWGVDNEYKNKGIKKQGILIAKYHFSENKPCLFSGIFDGLLLTSWYTDKTGKLKYDDIEKESDSYTNNQFVGTWKTYRGDIVKFSNWGDYRIPLSGDLDIGAGEFSPAEKYLQFGWQTYRDAYIESDKQARQEEERLWWK
jgi:hypothetical protein